MLAVRAPEWGLSRTAFLRSEPVGHLAPSPVLLHPWMRPHEAVPRSVTRRNEPEWSEEALLEGCRRGDPFAWRALVRRYARLVYGIARTIGLQPADADEVFQDSFEALLRSIRTIRDPHRLEAWLVTTSRRASLRLIRRERNRLRLAHVVAGELSARGSTDLAGRLERLLDEERVRRAVESLGEPCRTLLIALFADRPRPYRELARTLGLARGSIGATRARCLERLRRRMQQVRSRANGGKS